VNEGGKANFPAHKRLMNNVKVGIFPEKFIIFVHGGRQRQLRWYCVHWKTPRDRHSEPVHTITLTSLGSILTSASHVHLVYCVIYYLHILNKYFLYISDLEKRN
jgi:hypothetical protein